MSWSWTTVRVTGPARPPWKRGPTSCACRGTAARAGRSRRASGRLATPGPTCWSTRTSVSAPRRPSGCSRRSSPATPAWPWPCCRGQGPRAGSAWSAGLRDGASPGPRGGGRGRRCRGSAPSTVRRSDRSCPWRPASGSRPAWGSTRCAPAPGWSRSTCPSSTGRPAGARPDSPTGAARAETSCEPWPAASGGDGSAGGLPLAQEPWPWARWQGSPRGERRRWRRSVGGGRRFWCSACPGSNGTTSRRGGCRRCAVWWPGERRRRWWWVPTAVPVAPPTATRPWGPGRPPSGDRRGRRRRRWEATPWPASRGRGRRRPSRSSPRRARSGRPGRRLTAGGWSPPRCPGAWARPFIAPVCAPVPWGSRPRRWRSWTWVGGSTSALWPRRALRFRGGPSSPPTSTPPASRPRSPARWNTPRSWSPTPARSSGPTRWGSCPSRRARRTCTGGAWPSPTPCSPGLWGCCRRARSWWWSPPGRAQHLDPW